MGERDKEEPSFKIVDKRRFTASGEVRADAPPEEPPKPAPKPEATADPRRKQEKAAGAGSQSSIDFISFVGSLATHAMAALGMLPEAQARGVPVNHQAAHEYIEIIAMLQERTAGNLDRQEQASLNRLLSELRLQFVEATSKVSVPRPGAPGVPGSAKMRHRH